MKDQEAEYLVDEFYHSILGADDGPGLSGLARQDEARAKLIAALKTPTPSPGPALPITGTGIVQPLDGARYSTSESPAPHGELREALAALCHEQWSGWMAHILALSFTEPDNRKTLPTWGVERWTRQMRTPYAELSEGEKQSDRNEADRILALIPGPKGIKEPSEPCRDLDLLMCTGCGHDRREKILPPHLACCPDSRYRTLREILREMGAEWVINILDKSNFPVLSGEPKGEPSNPIPDSPPKAEPPTAREWMVTGIHYPLGQWIVEGPQLGSDKITVREVLKGESPPPSNEVLREALQQISDGLPCYTPCDIGKKSECVTCGHKTEVSWCAGCVARAALGGSGQSPSPSPDLEALGYAQRIATFLTHKHYPENKAWKPLDTIQGVLSQIDNVTCGLVQPPSPSIREAFPSFESWWMDYVADQDRSMGPKYVSYQAAKRAWVAALGGRE